MHSVLCYLFRAEGPLVGCCAKLIVAIDYFASGFQACAPGGWLLRESAQPPIADESLHCSETTRWATRRHPADTNFDRQRHQTGLKSRRLSITRIVIVRLSLTTRVLLEPLRTGGI